MAPPALRSWHDASALHALRSALHGMQLDGGMLLHITEGKWNFLGRSAQFNSLCYVDALLPVATLMASWW